MRKVGEAAIIDELAGGRGESLPTAATKLVFCFISMKVGAVV
jgi:hypothetical protein